MGKNSSDFMTKGSHPYYLKKILKLKEGGEQAREINERMEGPRAGTGISERKEAYKWQIKRTMITCIGNQQNSN